MASEQTSFANAAPRTRPALPPFLERIRLRARRRVLWMSAFCEPSQGSDGLAISPDEVHRVLNDPAEAAEREEAFYQTDATARQLGSAAESADADFRAQPEWDRLRQCFGLSAFEIDLLTMAIAVGVDPWLRRAYAYLQDDATAGGATPWLACELFRTMAPGTSGVTSGLVRSRLARPADDAANPWSPAAPWVVDPYLINWLAGQRAADLALNNSVELLPHAASESKPCLYPDLLGGMVEFVRSAPPQNGVPGVCIELIGPSGSGKRTLAGQFSSMLGSDLIAVDAETLLPPETTPAVAEDRVIRVIRMGVLEGALVYWHRCGGMGARTWQLLGRLPGVTLIGAEKPVSAEGKGVATRRAFSLPALQRKTRIALWERLVPEPPPPVIGDWILTPAEISAAARVASAGPEAVAQICQENLQTAPAGLFTQLPCPFTWEDIVLPYYLRQHLAEFEQQVRLRWQVYEDWGFERLCPLGRGITALFAGPSGTGKTMAAQVLAREVGMRLYRVDLSAVVNKYIGETEKRLKQVFDACERANVVLFFDEADALFGQRTQVKDAHDRFANIEIDYLLQRMEQFDGVAILATNRKGDLDKAFVRRIRFIVDFVPPGPPERNALWRRCLAANSPAGEQILDAIDWELLSQKLNMTGADIAATALGAAFLARAEGARIGMTHLLHAARRQMNKQGIALRAGELEW